MRANTDQQGAVQGAGGRRRRGGPCRHVHIPLWFAGSAGGFTALEIMMVLAVAGILAMLAAPRIQSFVDGMRLRTASDTIRRQLMAAKIRAVANPQVHCGVFVDTTNSRTLVFFDIGPTSRYVYDATEDRPYGGSEVVLPQGVRVGFTPSGGSTTNAIVFRGDGSAKYGGNVEVRSARGRRAVVRVLAVTGEVRVLWM